MHCGQTSVACVGEGFRRAAYSFEAKKVKASTRPCYSKPVGFAIRSRYHHVHPHCHLATWSPKPWMGWRLDRFRKLTVQDWPTRIYWSACIQSKVACLTVENSRLISQKTLCLAYMIPVRGSLPPPPPPWWGTFGSSRSCTKGWTVQYGNVDN